MSDLQQVITELKTRGLRAGEEEGAKLVSDAQTEAAKIVEEANGQAAKIVANAQTEAKATRAQLDAELRQASAVGLEAFRQGVEKSFLVPSVEAGARSVLDDTTTLKEVIVETVKGFASSGGSQTDLEVILPAALQQKMDAAFVATLKMEAATGVQVTFEDGFSFGFKLSPEDSGYVFDFTEDGFREIFLKFIAPRFRMYFFAE